MSKLKKAFSDPKRFIVDAYKNRQAVRDFRRRVATARNTGRKVAVLIGFSVWKTWMRNFLPDHEVIYLGHSPRVPSHLLRAIPKLGDVEVFVWSYKYPPELKRICAEAGISLTFVEDGWIRSVGLGIMKSTPLSLVFDQRAMHFDRAKTSDLEQLLSTYDFDANPELMGRARSMMANLMGSKVSKYNGLGADMDIRKTLGLDADQDCVLVIGQVEDDLSLAYGMARPMSGNELVMRAAIENPGAVILYRPHPETRVVRKKHYSNPEDVSHIAYVVPEEASLHACFEAATKVYAMTSLAGFEALLYGLPVKTFGCPFYAGWGLTEDVDPVAARRTRRLSLDEVFAAAYILYPRYLDPAALAPVKPEAVLDFMSEMQGGTDKNTGHAIEPAFAGCRKVIAAE